VLEDWDHGLQQEDHLSVQPSGQFVITEQVELERSSSALSAHEACTASLLGTVRSESTRSLERLTLPSTDPPTREHGSRVPHCALGKSKWPDL